jgi:hypothetical protein
MLTLPFTDLGSRMYIISDVVLKRMHIVAFQQLEVDYCAGKPDAKYRSPSQEGLTTVPVVRMYGVTDEGADPVKP